MNPNQSRENNPMWKGGRSISSHGYVLIRVGSDHHLADIRGYAYEHRLIAEEKLGRKLRKREIVHHINENKQDNRPENIRVLENIAEHRLRHRSKNSNLRLPNESNPIITCLCGCGLEFRKVDVVGRPRMYVSGHNSMSAQ